MLLRSPDQQRSFIQTQMTLVSRPPSVVGCTPTLALLHLASRLWALRSLCGLVPRPRRFLPHLQTGRCSRLVLLRTPPVVSADFRSVCRQRHLLFTRGRRR